MLARQVVIWCGPTTANEDFPVLEAIARWSRMINCVLYTQDAVISFKDQDARRAARLRLPCAGNLFLIKEARENAESGTLYLLKKTHLFDAADPRDKVFALVGLANDIDKSFVDYSKSYDDVMRDLNLMLLEGRIEPTMGSVLDVWSSITRKEDDEIAEPSWVADIFEPQSCEGLYTPIMDVYPSNEPLIERKPELRFLEVDGQKARFTFDPSFHLH